MDLQLLCLVVAVAFSCLTAPTLAGTPYTVPVQTVRGALNMCPAEALLAEARQATEDEINSALSAGTSEDNPVGSCNEIPSYMASGYYWILPPAALQPVQVYCDLDRQCRCDGPSTWTRVAFLDMSNPDQSCPGSLTLYSTPRSCGRGLFSGCTSLTYSNYGLPYSRVCGRIIGYQNYATSAFFSVIRLGATLEGAYVSGVSLTHGSAGSRQHIWSFASALGENADVPGDQFDRAALCSCTNSSLDWPFSTSFVGNNYFCETANVADIENRIYSEDPLWDGSGCGSNSTCCQFNTPPWFCTSLPGPTTDDLEVRSCVTSASPTGEVLIQMIELYVQ